MVRAKVPPPLKKNPRRKIPGMRKCGRQCHACPYIKEEKQLKCGETIWKLSKELNCKDKNVIYMIECSKCYSKYIGETERELKDRISDHKTYIRSEKLNQPVGEHFNLPGHSIDNLTVIILEKVKVNNELYRKEREKYLIRKFDTYHNGMNKNQGG